MTGVRKGAVRRALAGFARYKRGVNARRRSLVAGVLVLGACAAAVRLCPVPADLLELPASTRITAADGTLLWEFAGAGGERGRPVPLSEISPHVVNATLAGEDHRFFHHPGVDPWAMVRATWLNATTSRRFGGSTLTQQLVRMARPGARTWARKLSEAWWALVLEAHLSKQEILERYLARAPYGGPIVGIEAAARFYFGKGAGALGLAEASLLAVIPRAPVAYDLRRGTQAAVRRRAHVLGAMVKHGWITAEQRERAEAEPLQLAFAGAEGLAPHAAWRVLEEWPAERARPREVRTTLDASLQRRAEELASRTVEELGARGVHQVAAVVVELPGGQVRAYVGSTGLADEEHAGHVDGLRAFRSPGSALKPLVYARALERGMTAASLLSDVERAFPSARGAWMPRNFDRVEHGPVRLRTALANSFNVAAADVAERLGERELQDVLSTWGIRTAQGAEADTGLGVVLGGVDVRPWDVAGAYFALARGGVAGRLGLRADAPAIEGRRVLDEARAFIVSDMLADDDARATAFGRRSALHLPFWAAVKTGTSKDFRDNWAVGFSTRFLVLAWAGDFTGMPMRGVSGITGAGLLWHRLMRSVHADADPPPPRAPGHVTRSRVCALSGMTPGAACPRVVDELFAGDGPSTEPCTFHVEPGVVRYPPPWTQWAERRGRAVTVEGTSEVRVVEPRDGEVLHRDADRVVAGRGFSVVATGPAGEELQVEVDGVERARGRGRVTVMVPAVPGSHAVVARAGEREHRVDFSVQ